MSSYNIFANGIATRPSVLAELGYFGNDSAWLTDNDTFAWDLTGSSHALASLNNIGGRPCISLTSDGNATTDYGQFQSTVAGILLGTSTQTYRQKGSFRMASVATQELSFGLSTVNTSLFANVGSLTDYLMIKKLTGATSFNLVYRKASGTAQASGTFGPTLAADTWYDYELVFTKANSTVGSGRVTIYMGTDLAAGGTLSQVFDQVIATEFPDTVKMASFGAWRAGTAAAVASYMNYFGVRMV